jgi:dephospho-CoA kinase
MRTVIIGLTGSSGSGKSEAAKVLSGLGATVIDADAISREIVNRRQTLDELVNAFGGWVVDEQGRFNRTRVSKRAFSDNAFLARLTVITHKYIAEDIYMRVDAIKSDSCDNSGARYIVIDAPLPVERGFLDLADVVWMIKSPRDQRVHRIVARDNISAGGAEARFASQLSDAEYEKLADVVIHNDGSLAELENEIKRCFGQLKINGDEL